MNELLRKSDEMSRRRFISRTAKTCLGVSLLPHAMRNEILAATAKPGHKPTARNVIFLGLLSRYPRDSDRELMDKQVAKYGEAKAFENITWALMNTQEFVFFQ